LVTTVSPIWTSCSPPPPPAASQSTSPKPSWPATLSLAWGRDARRRGLNFGDCFSYALAKAAGRPLLCKGSDFSRTDLAPASE
jgi:hypothetical protein